MKDLLEKRYNCKVIDYCEFCYWTFRYKGHLFYLGAIFLQPYGSKSGCDYYTLCCDNRTLVRRGTFETCLSLIDKYD